VQVSAGLALGVNIDLENDPRGARFAPVATYATTKLWNLLATFDFATELQATAVRLAIEAEKAVVRKTVKILEEHRNSPLRRRD